MKAVPVVCIYGSEEQAEVRGKVKNINFVEKIVREAIIMITHTRVWRQ